MRWARPNVRDEWLPALALLGPLLVLFTGCASRQTVKPSIELSVIPPAAEGGRNKRAPIAGRVVGFRPGQQIVLFAKAGKWWVQPTVDQPFTKIQIPSGPTQSTWAASTQPCLLKQVIVHHLRSTFCQPKAVQ